MMQGGVTVKVGGFMQSSMLGWVSFWFSESGWTSSHGYFAFIVKQKISNDKNLCQSYKKQIFNAFHSFIVADYNHKVKSDFSRFSQLHHVQWNCPARSAANTVGTHGPEPGAKAQVFEKGPRFHLVTIFWDNTLIYIVYLHIIIFQAGVYFVQCRFYQPCFWMLLMFSVMYNKLKKLTGHSLEMQIKKDVKVLWLLQKMFTSVGDRG